MTNHCASCFRWKHFGSGEVASSPGNVYVFIYMQIYEYYMPAGVEERKPSLHLNQFAIIRGGLRRHSERLDHVVYKTQTWT